MVDVITSDFAINWLCATLGAFVLYIVSLRYKRQPFSLFNALETATASNSSTRSKPGVLADMLISSGIGALLLVIMLNPCSYTDASFMGLGLSGILSAFAKG